MGLLADIKALLKKHIKNPFMLGGIAYIVYKILSPRLKENVGMEESIKILKRYNDVEIILDTEDDSFHVIKGTKSIPAKSMGDAELKAKKLLKENITIDKLYEKIKLR